MSNTARKTVTYRIKKWTRESFIKGWESIILSLSKDQFNGFFALRTE